MVYERTKQTAVLGVDAYARSVRIPPDRARLLEGRPAQSSYMVPLDSARYRNRGINPTRQPNENDYDRIRLWRRPASSGRNRANCNRTNALDVGAWRDADAYRVHRHHAVPQYVRQSDAHPQCRRHRDVHCWHADMD